MNSTADGEVTDAFCAACRKCQVAPDFVLQSFADAVSVHGFLNPVAEPAIYLASKIVLGFSKGHHPLIAINLRKRARAIHNIRHILKVLQSLMPEEQKEATCRRITLHWYKANGIRGAGTELSLADTLSIALPKGLLLECDLLRCRPQDLLHYFMSLMIQDVGETNPNGPAVQFLLYCVSLVYPVENN